MTWKVPLFDLEYDEQEQEAVLAVLRSKWLTMGDRTAEFERALQETLGAPFALACANGTAALHMALRAAGIGPGDEVIVPDLTFVATANAVLYQGAAPVFADVVGECDLTIDPQDIRRKITPQTRAIMVVHYAGYPARMDEIMRVAEEHGLVVIEDCAHAPGAEFEGRGLGTIGDFGCFSFFSNKNLATGEGGAIFCHDAETAEQLRLLRSHGMTAQTLDRHKGHAWGYDVVELGYNYRLTEIEAALGLIQLSKLGRGNEHRNRHVQHYRQLLGEMPGLVIPFAGFAEGRWPFAGVSSYHLAVALLPEGISQRAVAEAMAADGVQTSVHYRPLHTFSSRGLASAPAAGLLNVTAISPRLITLPLWPGMGEQAVEVAARALLDAVRTLR